MPLDIKTALDTARQAWVDNSNYMGAGSAAMAQAFIAAGRQMIVLMPEEAGTRAATTRMRVESIENQITAAEAWLQANPTAGTSAVNGYTTRGDVSNFRQ